MGMTTAQKVHESQNDHLIDELIKDPRYKIDEDGKIFTKLTLNGQGLTDDWREIGYKKADGYVRIRYKDDFLFVQRVIYKKFKGDLKPLMTINHINLDHGDNHPDNLEMVTQAVNNQKKHKHYKKKDKAAFLREVVAKIMTAAPTMDTLKDGKKPLTPEERSEVMKAGAVWHHGPHGEETPAVWKSVVKGKTWYVCNTHRAMQVKPTLKGAITAFKFIKTTAAVVIPPHQDQHLKAPMMKDKVPALVYRDIALKELKKKNPHVNWEDLFKDVKDDRKKAVASILERYFEASNKVDLHGKSKEDAEKIIDRLAVKGGLWEIVTGHGKGILKQLIQDLQKIYHYKIISTAPNQAAYMVDFG